MTFEPITITLSYPVQHGQETVSSLVIPRRMVGGDLRGIRIAELNHEDMAVIGSRLTGYPPSVLSSLDIDDYLELEVVITGFLGSSRRTGTNA
jgi:hypothetical protein